VHSLQRKCGCGQAKDSLTQRNQVVVNRHTAGYFLDTNALICCQISKWIKIIETN